MSEQRNSRPRPNPATICVALLAGLAAPDRAQFTETGDLGFDASGNLHVLDAEAFRVVVINPAGESLYAQGAIYAHRAAFWEVDEMDVPSIVVKRVPEGVR